MTSRAAAILGVLGGLILWPIIIVAIYLSVPADTEAQKKIVEACASLSLECLKSIASNITPSLAQGAVLGLIGLLIQLWWRGEWPTGQLNAGRPNVLDPKRLVTVTIAAMVAGISAAPFASSKLSALGVVALSYLAADAATIGVDKIAAAAEWVKAKLDKLAGSK